MNDIRRMRQQFVNYLRFAGVSVVTLVIAICVKLTPAAHAMGPPEPRLGDPPVASQTETPVAATQNQRIELLETEVARLNADLTNLRSALSLMGPLPDHADLSLPVDPNAAASEAQAAPDPLASITKSDLFAPPPALTGGHSLFYEAELGSFRTRQAAEADWRRMAKNARLAVMTPRYATAGAETRLVVGSLPSPAAADALCIELSALTGACRPVVPVRAY